MFTKSLKNPQKIEDFLGVRKCEAFSKVLRIFTVANFQFANNVKIFNFHMLSSSIHLKNKTTIIITGD